MRFAGSGVSAMMFEDKRQPCVVLFLLLIYTASGEVLASCLLMGGFTQGNSSPSAIILSR